MKKKETMIISNKLYENFFISAFDDKVMIDDYKEANRFRINHKGAVGILPITKDGYILLVEQFRYAINDFIVEVPAGLKDKQAERSIQTIMRELNEETGYTTDDIQFIMSFYVSVGYTNEKIDLYIARDCELSDIKLPLDEGENISIHKIHLDKAKEMLMHNEFQDSKLIILLQYYFMNQ